MANQLRDNFADLSEKDIALLKKQARLTSHTEGELQNLADELSLKTGRTVLLCEKYVPDELIDTCTKLLDPLLLYKEICERVEKKTKTPLVHNHEAKQSDIIYRSLFKWSKYTTNTEPFIKPVQYCIFNEKMQTTRSTASTVMDSPLTLDNKDLEVAVQDKLVESHYDREALLTPELVEPIERVLQGGLIKLMVVKDLVFYFFEWAEPMPFVFVMAFKIFFSDKAARNFALSTVVTLHRKDIMEYDDDDDEENLKDVVNHTTTEPEKTKTKKSSKKKKKKQQQNSFNQSSKYIKSTKLYDMDEDSDKEEKEDEDDDEGMDDETIKYMDSADVDQERALLSFIQCIRTSCISYLTSAYLPRD